MDGICVLGIRLAKLAISLHSAQALLTSDFTYCRWYLVFLLFQANFESWKYILQLF